MLVTTWLSNIAFHLLPIWLQTLVAINSESSLTSFPTFCAQPSVLFYLNLSRRPFLRQLLISPCCFAQDLNQNMRFCSDVIGTNQDQWLIERLGQAMGAALVCIDSATTSRQFYWIGARRLWRYCQPLEILPDDRQGLKLGLKLELCLLTNEL